MRSTVKILIIFLLSFNTSYASDKIAYLDIDFILSKSNKGKLLLNELEKKNKENLLSLEKKEKILKNIELDIENKKNILSKEELNNQVDELKQKILIYRKEKDKLVKEFNIYKKKEITSLLTLINPIISKYVEDKSINIVLDKKNILIGKKSYDITEEILELVNKNIK